MSAATTTATPNYDIRNYFTASCVWQTPFKFGNKFVNGAFGGWTISQNFFARSGLPFTVLDGNTGIGNWQPNSGINIASIVPGVVAQQGCSNGLSQGVNPASILNTSVVPSPTFSRERRMTGTGGCREGRDGSTKKPVKARQVTAESKSQKKLHDTVGIYLLGIV